jgi:hypothetical protein
MLYGFLASKDHPLDIMHLVRNFALHISNILRGKGIRLPKVPEKLKKGKSETAAAYEARVLEQKTTYEEAKAAVNAANELLKPLMLTQKQRDELERRYAAVKAPVGLKGKGRLFDKSCYMTAAEWYFFIKYCSTWIFKGLLEGPPFEMVTLLFQVMLFPRLGGGGGGGWALFKSWTFY